MFRPDVFKLKFRPKRIKRQYMPKRIEISFDLTTWGIPSQFHSEISQYYFPASHHHYQPLIIDDRSHVRSIIFVDEDDQEAKKSTSLFFSTLYSGTSTISFPSSSSLSNLNILLLHSLLRINRKIRVDGDDGRTNMDTVNMFLMRENNGDDENNINKRSEDELNFMKEISDNEEKKVKFISENLSFLMNKLTPNIFDNDDQNNSSSPKEEKELIVNISRDDLSSFFDNPELIDRLLFSYSIILTGFGLRLHDFQDGTVDRLTPFWKEEYQQLDDKNDDCTSPSSIRDHRTFFIQSFTRLIRSLLDFRLRKITKKLVQFFVEEICEGRLEFLRNVVEFVWMPMVLVTGFDEETGKWSFDQEQKKLWLKKLKEAEEDDDESSDEDD